LGRRINKRAVLGLKLLVSIGALVFILARSGPSSVFGTLLSIDKVHFLGSSLLYIISIVISSLRWRLLILTDKKDSGTGSDEESGEGEFVKPSLYRFFRLYMVGAFFNNILPGVIGGDAFRIYYLYRDTRLSHIAFGSVFGDRYVGFAGLLLLGLLVLPFGLQRDGVKEIVWVVPMIVVAFILGSLLFFGLRLGRRIKSVSAFYEYFSLLSQRKNTILKTLMLSLIIQLIGIISVYIISRGTGTEIGFIDLCIMLPIIITITTVPVSISGIGVREGAFVYLLGKLGVGSGVATSISLAWFLSYSIGSMPGFYYYLKWRRLEPGGIDKLKEESPNQKDS